MRYSHRVSFACLLRFEFGKLLQPVGRHRNSHNGPNWNLGELEMVMARNKETRRRLLALLPLQLVILAIGARYAIEARGIPKLAGWIIALGSLITLAVYFLAIWRDR